MPDFVDPETHEPLVLADAPTLQKLRDHLAAGSARRVDGAAVPSFDGAYLTRDGRRAHLVIEGIPTFLVEARIALDPPITVSAAAKSAADPADSGDKSAADPADSGDKSAADPADSGDDSGDKSELSR
ncbi:MAG: hypothetical protein MUE69_31670 [Myxococcota bacterium]|nr:hypothetical protein [Myxococcota bacterium]